MKILKILLVFVLFSSVLSGCSRKQAVDMNQLSEDNRFHYVNDDLKFAVDLPSEFIYYQTQKKTDAKSTNIEFFVPTSDMEYRTDVQSYGKVLVVSIFDEAKWNDLADKGGMEQVGKGNGKIYAIQFWKTAPKDWQSKWNDGLTKAIKDSFKVK